MNQEKQLPVGEVFLIDKLTYASNNSWDNLGKEKNKVKLIEKDINEEIEIEKNIDVIINFAAESHVDRSLEGPQQVAKTNFSGTVNLLDFAQRNKVKLFVQISTDEVYGSTNPKSPTDENGKLEPSSIYSASKTASDLAAKAYNKSFGIPIVITRCTNNYGPYQHPEKLIPRFIMRSLNDQELPLYDGGYQKRDWIHVDDHNNAILLLVEKHFQENGLEHQIYNISGQNLISNREITEKIIKTVAKIKGSCRSKIKTIEDRPGHDKCYAITDNRLRNLGWSNKINFEEGLLETVNWYHDHTNWANPRWQDAESFYSKK